MSTPSVAIGAAAATLPALLALYSRYAREKRQKRGARSTVRQPDGSQNLPRLGHFVAFS
jgi:hypothetical protein